MEDRPGLHAMRRTTYAIVAHIKRLRTAPALSKVEEARMIEEYLRTRGATICPPRFAGHSVQFKSAAHVRERGADFNRGVVRARFIEGGFE